MTDETLTAPATEAGQGDSAQPATGGGKTEIAEQLRSNLESDAKSSKLDQSPHERLRADIETALTKETSPKDDKPSVKVDQTGRAHGPDGKFAPKAGDDKAPEAALEAKPADQPAVTQDQAPASWKRDIAAKHWSGLDPELKAYLGEREGQMQKLWQEHQPLKPLAPVIAFAGEIAPRLGTNPQQLVASWAQFQAALMDPAQKVQAAQWLLRQYDIKLPDAHTQPAAEQPKSADVWEDPEIAALKAQIAEQNKRWASLEQEATKYHEQQAVEVRNGKLSTFDKFIAEKGQDGQLLRPYMGDQTVLAAMPGIITVLKTANPQLSDQDALQQAYDQIVWGNPAMREKILSEQRAAEDRDRAEKARVRAQAASRAVVSPASASPQGPPPTAPLKGDIRSQMMQAFQQVTA